MAEDQTTCALLTPAGRGAIATIGVRGPAAVPVVGRVFRPLSGLPLGARQAGEIVIGVFSAGLADGEELVVGLVAANHTEIHCHGGLAATSAILDVLSREGCLVQTSAAWALGSEGDPLRAAASLALSQAATARTAAYLLDQQQGALSEACGRIRDWKAAGDEQAAETMIRELLRFADFGRHLTQPWRVVLAGRPNSGKSSLMNAIMGYQRSIVFDQPGTTRDVLLATTAMDGWPVELRDMAGLREGSDALEAAGVERAWQEIAAADLVLLVSDISARWDAALYEQVRDVSPKPVLVVHNKCDLAALPDENRLAGQRVSAASGWGVDELCQRIIQTLIPEVPPRGSPLPVTREQRDRLQALLKPAG